MKSTVLPESFLKCMSEADRKTLGKAGRTQAEANEVNEKRTEKLLQRDCLNLLRLHGIEVIVNRMDRKTSNNLGTPDFLFGVIGHDGHMPRVYACAIEIKLPGRHLNLHQREMRKWMTSSPNHWTCKTITSVDELKVFLSGIGL